MRIALLSVLLMSSTIAHAASTLNTASLALKSSGHAEGQAWTLDQNGFVGTYLKLDAPAKVSVTVVATGNGAHMNIVVADTRTGFDLTADVKPCVHATDLPAGLHLLRVEMTNDSPAARKSVRIASIDIDGATVVNEHTNANALAAADTYITKFRKGQATVTVSGAAKGTPVRIKLCNHAFNFGICLTIERSNGLLTENPAPDSDAFKYQQFVNANFNTIVAGNAGKWENNEPKPGDVTMDQVDLLLDYGKKHDKRVRMHTLIWSNQQPKWVHALLDRAKAGDEGAKTELRAAIARRIGYYVRDRAGRYIDLDVLNEAIRNPSYWTLFGPASVADIFNECARATDARLYTNEYNVVQWSFTEDGKPDPYANWYRKEVEDIRSAGGAVTAVGVQYYADISTGAQKDGPHSAARIMGALQNLSVTGLPICLTEFGVQRGKDKSADPKLAAQALQESLRLVFGTEQANGLLVWGFRMPWLWERADVGALLDENWNPTPAGRAFLDLMKQWSTDVSTTTDADGQFNFTGFYGDYDVTVGGKTLPLKLVKGTKSYTLRP